MNLAIHDLASEIRETFKVDKQSNLPYISLDDIEPHSLSLKSYGSSDEVQSHKYRFKKGDILFGTLRPYFCKLVVCPFDGVCSTEFSVIRPKDDNDINFLFFTLAQKNFIEHATVNSNGGRPRTSWKLFSGFSVPYFNKKERLEIGEFLSNYSRLIENNYRQIQLLEQAARLIYEEWFICFRFPGHEKVRIVDGLPEGWRMGIISDFFQTGSGGTPSRKENGYYGGDIKWVKTQELKNGYIINTDETISESGLKNSSAKLFPRNTVLIAMYGATIGQLGILNEPMTSNQACCALISKTNESYFIFIFLYLFFSKEKLIKQSKGSAQNNISQEIVKNFPLLIPSKDLLDSFTQSLLPSFELIANLQMQNLRLKEARNLLLSKLMNGEIQL